MKYLDHNTSLVAFKSLISTLFDLKRPFGPEYGTIWWRGNNNPSFILEKGLKLGGHGIMQLRILWGLGIWSGILRNWDGYNSMIGRWWFQCGPGYGTIGMLKRTIKIGLRVDSHRMMRYIGGGEWGTEDWECEGDDGFVKLGVECEDGLKGVRVGFRFGVGGCELELKVWKSERGAQEK